MPSMAKTFREWNPEQSMMFPPAVLDLVEPGDLVHFMRNLVMEQLDLGEIFGAIRRGARLSADASGDDDGAAALQLLPGNLRIAADRAGV